MQANVLKFFFLTSAGVMAVPHTVTKDGFELQMASNYLGHFLLSHVLMPQLIAGGLDSKSKARIVNVSSCAHFAGKFNYENFSDENYYYEGIAYANSKFFCLLINFKFIKKLNLNLYKKKFQANMLRFYSQTTWICYARKMTGMLRFSRVIQELSTQKYFKILSLDLSRDWGKFFSRWVLGKF